MIHTQTATLHISSMIQVLCYRSVCVLFVLCVLLLPEICNSAKSRCGVELMADLEFVCGDRGFYRGGRGSSGRGIAPRLRGKGIVDQCCIKSCDLQHLERYCASPKRTRRNTDNLTEEQFRVVFFRQYERNLYRTQQKKYMERLEEQTLYLHRRTGGPVWYYLHQKDLKWNQRHR